MIIKIFVKAIPGDRVVVNNYRRAGHWEDGTVTDTKVSIHPGQVVGWVDQYRVILDRKSAKGNIITITVGASGIMKGSKRRGRG